MGDRVSISFSNGVESSVALFSHWGGMEFVKEATDYAIRLYLNSLFQGTKSPLWRLSPDTMMVDFIREITKGMKVVDGDFYLGKNENDGDNSDNGHHIINPKEEYEAIQETSRYWAQQKNLIRMKIEKEKGGKP